MKRRSFLLVLIALCIVAVAIGLVFFIGYERISSIFSIESIDYIVNYLRSLGWIGPAASVGLMVLQSIVAPLPSFVIAAANGMVFGVFWGTVISWIGGMAGAILNFWIARKLGHAFFQKWTKKANAMKHIDKISGKNGFLVILVTRLVPIISFDAISLLAGLSSIRTSSFLIATGIGQLPGTIMYVLVGHDLANIETYQNRLWVVSLILISLIIIIKLRSKKNGSSTL
jgi:uncharacterized membrane protein YdjX (TVP38/TMEM64 family)